MVLYETYSHDSSSGSSTASFKGADYSISCTALSSDGTVTPDSYEPELLRKISDTDKNTLRSSYNSTKSRRRFSLLPVDSTEERYREPIGLEPGINPYTTTVQLDESVGSDITIIDFSDKDIEIETFSVGTKGGEDSDCDFEEHLKKRPKWAKLRWINVNGLSWEAIEPIAKYYDLHPLSVEDTLDIPQRPKMEVFPSHVFFCLPLHILTTNYQEVSRFNRVMNTIKSALLGRSSGGTPVTNSMKPTHTHTQTDRMDERSFGSPVSPCSKVQKALDETARRSIYLWDRSDAHGEYYQAQVRKKMPLDYQRRTVSIEQVSIFMNEDTVITMFERSAPRVIDPIVKRVLSSSTIIRQSADPTILVQSIIDTCVDHIQPIISEYRARIYRLQVEAVLHPTMRLTRAMHLLKTDLTVLTNTISPIIPFLNSFKARLPKPKDVLPRDNDSGFVAFTGGAHYMNDVVDHAQGYNQDLKQMMRFMDSISTLIFNTISIQSSDAVRLLSLVTVVFLPLTFLSGYFGMNFTDFDSLNNGLGYYWSLAAPCSAGLIVILMYDTAIDLFFKVCRWFKGNSTTPAHMGDSVG